MLSSLWTRIRACLGFDNSSANPRQSELHQSWYSANDNPRYQKLESMQELSQLTQKQPNHEITVRQVIFAERPSNLKQARAEIIINKPNAAQQWGWVRVERLVLEEGGKEALQNRLERELTEDELKTVSISILEQTCPADLWRDILQKKKEGYLSDLFNEEDLDWIKSPKNS